MANVGAVQRFPVTSHSENIIINNGSHGVFICDSNNAFDPDTLPEPNNGKRWGHAVKLYAEGVNNPIIGSISTNGMLGASLEREWPNGAGFVGEIMSMTMTQGFAEIILKQVNL